MVAVAGGRRRGAPGRHGRGARLRDRRAQRRHLPDDHAGLLGAGLLLLLAGHAAVWLRRREQRRAAGPRRRPGPGPAPLYYTTLVVSVLVFLGLRYVSRTPFGLALQGLRDEPTGCARAGFNVTRHRILAFGLAAFVAAIAGVLSVWYNRRISPGSINLAQTIDVLIIAVVGGLYRLEGAWVGALTYALLDNYSREWTPRSERPGPGALQHDHRGRLPRDRAGLARRPDGPVGARPRGSAPEDGAPGTRGDRGRGELTWRKTCTTNKQEEGLQSQDIAGADRRLAGPGPRDGLWRRRRRGRRWQRRVERPVRRRHDQGRVPVRLRGRFGSFFEPTASGFNQALIDKAGAKPAARSRARASPAPRSPARRSRSSGTAAPTTPPTRRSRRRAA